MPKKPESYYEELQFGLERDLQAFVLKRLKACAPYIKVIKVIKANTTGVSDLILCVKGKYVAVELKVKTNTTTELQRNFIADIIKAGGYAGVAYTWGDVKNIIRDAGYEFVGQT